MISIFGGERVSLLFYNNTTCQTINGFAYFMEAMQPLKGSDGFTIVRKTIL